MKAYARRLINTTGLIPAADARRKAAVEGGRRSTSPPAGPRVRAGTPVTPPAARRAPGPAHRPKPQALPSQPQQDVLTPAGLHRRLKRHLLKAPQTFLAICTPGFERFVQSESAALPGATPGRIIVGGVEFQGSLDLMYHANLRLRTASRVLMRVADVRAFSYPELYDKVRRVHWELYLGSVDAVSVEVSARESRVHHETNVAKTVYEGVQSVMQRLGVAVAHSEDARVRIYVRLYHDECTLSMDTSGEVLHKRGYREASAKAPIRETIAAGLLLACDWQRYPAIADPLCGSGTFAIEAAMMARRMCPGRLRSFAFEAWPSFHASKWERLRREAQAREDARATVRLVALDSNPGAIAATRANAARAGVLGELAIAQADCVDFNARGEFGATGLVIANLPYGKRVGERREIKGLYQEFAKRLCRSCAGWDFGFVIADETLLNGTGLQVERRLPFQNGGLDVVFVQGRIRRS
jgi:putative N6-adenine-specific DNA methylase